MKRSFIITLTLIAAIAVPLCASSGWARGLGVLGLGGGAGAGGDDYSDILLFNRMESTTLSTGDCYGADATMSGSGSISITTAAMKNGIYGLEKGATGGGYYQLDVSAGDIIDASEGRIGFWHYFIDARVTGQEMFRACGDSTDNDRITVTGWGSNLEFTYRTSAVAPATLSTSFAMSTGQWYFIEVAWKSSTGYREIFVDGVSKATSTTTMTAPVITKMFFGSYFSGAGVRYMDHYIVSSDSTRDLYSLRNTESCPK